MSKMYYTTTNKEYAARILMFVCLRDKVYSAKSDRMTSFNRTYNSGIVGETITGRKIGIFISNSDQYMLVIINEEMYQSTVFFPEVFGPIQKSDFKEFDWFNIDLGDIVIDNDIIDINDENSTYEDVCKTLGLEPINAEKEIDDLARRIKLPIAKIDDKEVSFDTTFVKHYVSMIPAIPASPEWRFMKAMTVVRDEWVRRVSKAADIAASNKFSKDFYYARKAIDEKGEIW